MYFDFLPKALDDLEGHVMAAEGGGGEESMSSGAQTLKRLAGMKRSYNLEIKLMSDPASKVRKPSFICARLRFRCFMVIALQSWTLPCGVVHR